MDRALFIVKVCMLLKKAYKIARRIPPLYMGFAFIYNWPAIDPINQETRRLLLGALFIVYALR